MSGTADEDNVIDPAFCGVEQQEASDEIAMPTGRKVGSAPLIEGSEWKAIWIMSWPLMITTVSTSLVGLIDLQVTGYIGSSAQAAVGVAEQVIFIFMVGIMSLGVGTTAIVSRAYGEDKPADANFATGQSLGLSIITGLVLTLLALFTAHYLLPLFSQAPDVVAQGTLYLGIFSLYIIPFSMASIGSAAFRAIGDAKTPLLIVLTEVAVNIAGDYLTVLGNWPVPGLGVRGVAYSAIAGALVGCFMALICIWRSPLKNSLTHLFPLSLTMVKRLLHIGIPAAMQRISWAASVFVVFFILSRLPQPTAALASWSIGMRVEGLLFMPLMALSLAVGSIVGQNLGAQQVDRAFRSGWTVSNIGVALMVVLGAALFFGADAMAAFMSHDPQTREITASYLRINALAEPFLAVNMVLSGALQGAGDTRITMWVSLFTNWLVRLPLAWYLASPLHWGPAGVWAAMSISVSVAALMIAARFQSRAWAKIKV